MATSFKIIFDAYCKLTATRRELQDNWICDETLLRLLDAHYPSLQNTFGFTRGRLVRALLAYVPPIFHIKHEHGVFLKQFKTSCPYDSTKRRRVSYFYRQWNDKPPADPVSVHDITDVHAERIQKWGVNTRLTRGLVTSASWDGGTGGRVMATADNNDDDDNRFDNATNRTVQNTPMRAAPRNNTKVDQNKDEDDVGQQIRQQRSQRPQFLTQQPTF